MGEVRMGPPTDLLREIKRCCGTRLFIETGTFRGDTAAWAASEFERVITIEFSRQLFDRAKRRLAPRDNVEVLFGDSRARLAELVPTLAQPAAFWLDAHWCSGETYGLADQCPLLDELAVINASPLGHAILVDDARFFLSPQPQPNRIDQWPSLAEVIARLSRGADRYIVVVEDVIVAVPAVAREAVALACQRANARVLSRRLLPLLQDFRQALRDPRAAARRLFAPKA
jgi:hypothetical protein